MAHGSDLVVVRSFSHPHEAYVACSVLEAAGLHACVADAHIVQADWLMSNAVGGVKVAVHRNDVREAVELLEGTAVVEIEGDAEGIELGDDEPEVECPRCGGVAVVRVVRWNWIAVLTWLIANVPLFPVRRRKRCATCGLVLDA